MSKKRKNFIRLIAVFVTVIILGSAVRVGMYYYEYRQDSKLLEFFKENESKSVFRGLVNDDGYLLLEHGWKQGEEVRSIFCQNHWQGVATIRDYGDNERVTLGYWKR